MIRRLLAKDRDLRYQSLEDVLFDIEPVAREIGQAQVAELLERGNEAILAGKYEEAQPIVRKILEVDPSNTQARQWREELRDRSRRIAVRPRIESLQEQANADAARRDYESAIAKIDSALRLDPTNSSLRARLEQFRAQLERVNRAKLLLSEARRDQEHGDLTAAFQHAQEAAATDPDNESAAAFARILEQLRLERDAQNKIKAVLNKSKSLMAVQAFAEAIDALAEALVEFPRNVEIRQMLAEAQQLRQAQDKQHKLALAIGETKLLIARASMPTRSPSSERSAGTRRVSR